MDRVDDHAVPARESGRPPKDGDLDAVGDKPEVESERGEERRRPRAGNGDHDRRLDAPVPRVDPHDPPALGHDARDLAPGLDGRAQALSGLGEGERRGVRVGEARVGLPGGRANVIDPASRQELG
jgi:hypothetical protein